MVIVGDIQNSHPYQGLSAKYCSLDVKFSYLCIIRYSQSTFSGFTASCQACIVDGCPWDRQLSIEYLLIMTQHKTFLLNVDCLGTTLIKPILGQSSQTSPSHVSWHSSERQHGLYHNLNATCRISYSYIRCDAAQFLSLFMQVLFRILGGMSGCPLTWLSEQPQ